LAVVEEIEETSCPFTNGYPQEIDILSTLRSRFSDLSGIKERVEERTDTSF